MTLRLLGFAALFAAALSSGYAQTDSARMAGLVADASGAVIPNAIVTIRNERTGESRKLVANERGQWVAAQLPPATYEIAAEAAGMSSAKYSGINLQVGQERTLNITLQPAAVSTEINVSGGDLAVIDVSSASLGVNVSGREVAALPMNGRQVSQLYLMTPGAVNYGSGSFDDIRFSGRSNEQNEIRFDGIEGTTIIDTSPGNFNGEVTGPFRLQMSLENVQEFRVESNNYPAEFGTGTGGQVSVVTKSGSNALHGSAFEYVRNDALDARNFFDGANASMLRLNQFGGSVGGAVVKDRLFFFAGYEGLRQRTAVPIIETTPSALAWSQAVSAVQPLRAAFPVGQTATSNPLLDLVNVRGPGSGNEDSGSARLDYNLSDKYRFYLRYFRDQGSALITQNSTGSYYTQAATPQNLVAAFNQTLTPTTINETKFGFNGAKTRVNATAPQVPGVDLTGVTLNLSGGVALSGISGQTGSASIAQPTGQLRLSSALNGRGAPYTNYSLSFIDNLTVIHGNHTLKFGVEVRPVTLYTQYLGGTTYSFSNINSFLADAPSSISFNGDTAALSPFTGKSGVTDMRQTYYIGYAQDEWKILPTLTMNYGLRYEYYSPLHEANNKNIVFDMSTGALIPNYTGDWYKMSTHNFGPRLAFSWAPGKLGGKTVFRIGSGYYYGPGQTEDQIQPAINDRINRTITSGALLAYPLSAQTILANYSINDPNLQFQPRAYAPGYTIPERILEYTASLEQQLPSNAVLTVAYVGSQGRNLFLRGVTNLITGLNMNPATGAGIPIRQYGNGLSEIDYKTSGGRDHYNGLQASLNRRFAQGLTLGAQYTWAHDIGNTDGANEARTAANNYSFAADYGNNTFDVRQSFNLSALYEVPFGRGRRYGGNSNALVKGVLGGWQVGGLANARTGLPIEVLITRPDIVYRNNLTGAITDAPVLSGGVPVTTPIVNVPGGGASRNVRRPDYVAGVDPYLRNSETQWLNPAAFAIPQPGTFGNLGRDALSGPRLQPDRSHAGQTLPHYRETESGVPHGDLQYLQPREFQSAGRGYRDAAGFHRHGRQSVAARTGVCRVHGGREFRGAHFDRVEPGRARHESSVPVFAAGQLLRPAASG